MKLSPVSRQPRLLPVSIALGLLASAGAYAQTTSGSIAGSVVDSQQAAIVNATVNIKDVSKGFAQSATTDREGRFVFLQLSPGTYTLSIESPGFKTNTRTNLLLVANDKQALGNITLEVGATTETGHRHFGSDAGAIGER